MPSLPDEAGVGVVGWRGGAVGPRHHGLGGVAPVHFSIALHGVAVQHSRSWAGATNAPIRHHPDLITCGNPAQGIFLCLL